MDVFFLFRGNGRLLISGDYNFVAGATQVGFNRVSGNLLATAHDGDLRIWDLRKGSCPIQYITAHLSR